jgi:tetratricopeptide (TPR) repeat protein
VGPALVNQRVRHAATFVGAQKLEEKAYGEALASFKTAIEADAFHPWPHYFSARSFAGLGQREKAMEALKKAYGLREDLTALDLPLPDASKDPAFALWAQDPTWQAAVSEVTR